MMKPLEDQPMTIQRITEVDMSPAAIDRRLRKVSQLFKLGMAIRKARATSTQTVEVPNVGLDQRSSPEVG